MEEKQTELGNHDSEDQAAIPTEAEISDLIQNTNPNEPKQLTEADFRQLRRMYFTVRHDIVHPCLHRLDRLNQPRTNCQFCWWNWFETHAELVKLADRAFIEQGTEFLDQMRGQKFRKFFIRYMATKLKLQEEQDALQNSTKSEGLLPKEQEEGSSDQQKVGTEESSTSDR